MKWIARKFSFLPLLAWKKGAEIGKWKKNREEEKMRNVLLNGRWALEDIRRRMRKFVFRRKLDCFSPTRNRRLRHSPNSCRCFKQSKWNWTRTKGKCEESTRNSRTSQFSGQLSSTTSRRQLYYDPLGLTDNNDITFLSFFRPRRAKKKLDSKWTERGCWIGRGAHISEDSEW